MPAADKARLIAIVKARSVTTGTTFKLASGRTSDFYCNLKPTMLHPEGAHLIASLVTFLIAYISFHVWEQPFLKLKDRLAPHAAEPRAITRAA